MSLSHDSGNRSSISPEVGAGVSDCKITARLSYKISRFIIDIDVVLSTLCLQCLQEFPPLWPLKHVFDLWPLKQLIARRLDVCSTQIVFSTPVGFNDRNFSSRAMLFRGITKLCKIRNWVEVEKVEIDVKESAFVDIHKHGSQSVSSFWQAKVLIQVANEVSEESWLKTKPILSMLYPGMRNRLFFSDSDSGPS